MNCLPSLDAHSHIALHHPVNRLQQVGFVLGMTLSLGEAEQAMKRPKTHILWGAGCYPGSVKAQAAFEPRKFRECLEKSVVVGEVGLDTGSQDPMEIQERYFRQILRMVAEKPCLVSIHSYRATSLVLQESGRIPVSTPVLHWWAGSADETSHAVELGCYFSVHSAVSRQSKFRTRVPPERILVESDHGYNDPPAAIPCRIEWVEHLVARHLRIDVTAVRLLVWRNYARIIHHRKLESFMPPGFQETIQAVNDHPWDGFQQVAF